MNESDTSQPIPYDPKSLRAIGHQVATQDNRITVNPLFVVEEEVKDWANDEDFTDGHDWVLDADGEMVTDEETIRGLDLYESEHLVIKGGFRKCYYKNRWHFVTACFTQKGCEDFLRLDGHNHGKTRIYVHGGFRNREWETLRSHLTREGKSKGDHLISFEDIPLGGRFKYPGSDAIWSVTGKWRKVDGGRLFGSISQWEPDMGTYGQWHGQSSCSHIPDDQGGDCPEMVIFIN